MEFVYKTTDEGAADSKKGEYSVEIACTLFRTVSINTTTCTSFQRFAFYKLHATRESTLYLPCRLQNLPQSGNHLFEFANTKNVGRMSKNQYWYNRIYISAVIQKYLVGRKMWLLRER